jgi:hypothetical protein
MKKAQITTFIIIGVILLIAVALFFFIRGELLKDIEPERVVPIEFMDINDYVEDCLKITSRDAIYLLGLQGGYIYLPDAIARQRDAHVEFVKNSDLKVPLWYYFGSYRYPLISDMERDINRYIIENMPLCINNFESFENKYVVDDYEIQPSTVISETDVLINLKYPLIVKNIANNQIADIDTFTSRHDVKLKRAYDLANEILFTNQHDQFLEHVAIDLMVVDPKIPFSGLEFTCNRKLWKTKDIVTRTKELFEYNIPLIRIKQTNYIPFSEDQEYEQLHMLWDLSTNNLYKDFRATFNYNSEWDLFMSGRPTDGQYLVGSIDETSFLRNLCINFYHFTYDLRFPIVVRLFDEHSFSGNGFEFLFSLPLYIDHNAPIRDNFGFTYTHFTELDEDFCSSTLPEKYTFKAYDKMYDMEIEDVEFNFDCFNKRCSLGNTTFDGFSFKTEAYLPDSCTGGFIVAEHPDFETVRKLIYLNDLQPNIEVTMREMKTLNLKITRHKSTNLFGPLEINDPYEILLVYTDKSNNETTYLSYPSEDNTIKLPYELSSIDLELLLVDNSNYILGGYYYNWTYSLSDIADANTLLLKVYEHNPAPISEEQSYELYEFVLTNSSQFDILKPRLVFENE